MPISTIRRLTGSVRTRNANYQLAAVLTFVAGATNAGGFLVVEQYTSHMTGILAAIADNLIMANFKLVLSGIAAVLSFVAGAMVSTMLIKYNRRLGRQSEYAAPLLLESLLLLGFGLLFNQLDRFEWLFIPVTVWVLCFVMGLQNALITVMSLSEIRTTHVTGMVTDIGIELGKLAYNYRLGADQQKSATHTNSHKLLLSMMLVLLFLAGGIIGAYGFKQVNYVFAISLSAILLVLASVPIVDDLLQKLR